MREVQTGVWHWEAPHPDWEPNQPWGQMVSSYAVDTGERLLLFDPLGIPGGIEELAAGRETAIVLTCPWHERDTESLVERFAWPVFAPPPDTAEDLMEKYGITAAQAGSGSPDLRWLKKGMPKRTGTRPATGSVSARNRSPGSFPTTACSGSRAGGQSSSATRSSSAAAASGSSASGCQR